MPIFFVVPLQQNHQELDEAIEGHVANSVDRYKLQAGAGWFVRFAGTANELSDLIGLTGQPQGQPSPLGSAVVAPITSYFGRGPTDMWEWLKTRFEQQ